MWRERIDQAGDRDWRARAIDALRWHGVVAYPTDTLYGLAADPRSAKAVAKLYRIKGRPVDHAIPLIAASRAQLHRCGAVLSPRAARLADRFWPGPLTLVVPAWDGLCLSLLAGGATVAVRVPDHEVARALAAAFGYPVTSTSANRSGGPGVTDPEAIVLTMGADLDGLLDAGMSPGGPASTIVDVTGGALRLVRDGAVPWSRVLEFER